jgi:predicted PP-loop superfamily ATPase
MNDQVEKRTMEELSAEWGCPLERPMHGRTTGLNTETMERVQQEARTGCFIPCGMSYVVS